MTKQKTYALPLKAKRVRQERKDGEYMPIAICRACKSYAGKAINYVMDEKKAERITTNGLDERRSLSQQFIDTAHLHGKGKVYDERKYYHIKFSFEPKDRIENGGKLNAELAEKIANQYLQEHYKGNEYILAVHTDKEHIHCHTIINAVSFEDGKKIHHSDYDLMKMKDQINDIAEQYGVSRFDWKQAVKKKREEKNQEIVKEPKELTQAEKYIKERYGNGWTSQSWKDTLRNKIDEAKEICTNRDELKFYLQDNYGIEMPRNTDKTISFKHPAVNVTIRGAKLGANYTSQAIDKELQKNFERGITNAELRPSEKEYSDTYRTITGIEQTEQDRIREQPAQGSISIVEQELRGITEGIKQLTSKGRAEQAERKRIADENAKRLADKERAARTAADQQRKQLANSERITKQQSKNPIKGFSQGR